MKKIITLVVLLVIAAGTMQAQTAPEPSLTATAKKEVTNLTADTVIQKLNITDQSKIASVKKIMGVFSQLRSEISSSTKTPQQKANAIQDINDRENVNMKNILGEDLYSRYLELKK